MIKKASIIALAFSIFVSGVAYAGNNETGTGTTKEESTIEWQYTFEEEKEFLKEYDISQTDLVTLEKLFNEAIALEKTNKSEAAEQKWDAYFNLLDEKLPETAYEDYTFEDEKEFLEELGFDAKEMATIEKLFNEAIALEEADKFEEAEKKWDAIYNLVEEKSPEMDYEEYTFENEKEFLEELGFDSAVMAELDELFNKAIALEEAGKDAEAEKVWESIDNLFESNLPEDFDEDFEQDYTFEDEKEFLKELGLTDEEMITIEKLFNEAIALEEADKFEEADKKWDAIYTIIDKKLPEDYDEAYTFEDEKEFLEELDLTEEDMAALEKLFNEAMILEEAGNDAEAESVWESFEKLLESNGSEDYEADYDYECDYDDTDDYDYGDDEEDNDNDDDVE